MNFISTLLQSNVNKVGIASVCVMLDENEHICTKSDRRLVDSHDWQYEVLPFNKARFIHNEENYTT